MATNFSNPYLAPQPGSSTAPPVFGYPGQTPPPPPGGYPQLGQREAVGTEAFNQADGQWMRQMQGLSGALSQYGTSDYWWNKMYANQGPGAAEQWWAQNQGAFNRPTNSQDVYGQYGQTNNADIYNGRNAAYGAIGNNFSQDAYGGLNRQLQAPSLSQGAYGQMQGAFGQPSAYNNWYSQASGQYAQPSRSEGLGFQGSDTSRGLVERSLGWMGANNTENASPELQGLYRGANDVQRYAGSQIGQLQGPGVYEQFVTSDIMGNNPALAMQRQEGNAAVNQEMARRGGFRSGAADTALAKYNANLDAKAYEGRADRAQQAQGMQLGRIGAGQSLAGASSTERIGQGSALQGLAGQRDNEGRARASLMLQATQQETQSDFENERLRQSLAGQADQSMLGRLAGGQAAAQGMGDDSYKRQLALMQGAGQADNQMMQRLQEQWANAQGLDASNLARGQFMFGMGRDMNAAQDQRYSLMGQLGQGADQQYLAQLLGGGQMANMAQGAYQDRINGMFDRRFGLDSSMAGLYAPFYGQGGQMQGQAFSDWLNYQSDQFRALSAKRAEQNALPFNIANLGIKGFAASQGVG